MGSLELHFGDGQNWQVKFNGVLRSGGGPGAEPCAAVEQLVARALAQPLDFPPIEQAIIPGDRVALIVDPLLPQMPEIVTACVRYLIQHSVDVEQLHIVLASHEPRDADLLRHALEQVSDYAIPIELHDADDSTKIAYVAANEDSDPIYMNRTVVDADVVLPITCSRGHSTLDYLGAYSVFPMLSNRSTRGEFYSLEKLSADNEHNKLTSWADQAAWWVGLMVVIQAVPARDQQIAAVVAGTPTAVEPEVQRLMTEHWQVPQESAELVIAMVDGGSAQQTWENLARALHTAKQLVSREGSIVMCTDIEHAPGPGLQKLRSVHNSSEKIARKLAHDSADDALAAAVILDATKDCHVYLVSRLRGDTVEGLGMGQIHDSNQLEHLLQQHRSCLVLTSAQHRCILA